MEVCKINANEYAFSQSNMRSEALAATDLLHHEFSVSFLDAGHEVLLVEVFFTGPLAPPQKGSE